MAAAELSAIGRDSTSEMGVLRSSGTARGGQLREAIDDALAWHDAMTDLIGWGTLIELGAWHVYGSLTTDVERLLADLDRVGVY
ncbi:hypothetical protein [Streptomyces sp. NPDC059668]|uniref:hypothetical protein n=1 Tax=Streptomyces sp. NPDC059668 TaxID=3346900 RepID=UPI0036B73C15